MYKILIIVLLGKSSAIASDDDDLFFLALLPVCTGLNCYYCATGMTGCNDPFSATSSNVSTTGPNSTNIYCVVSMCEVYIRLI
jgi:hypothetical protein